MPEVSRCEQALAQVTRQADPELWAGLQIELTISLGKNPLGDRDENLEKAISCNHQAQEVFTRQAYPNEWANIQTHLASNYRNRRRGSMMRT